jgi:hypothetical protein
VHPPATGDLLGYSDLNKQFHDLILTISGQATARSVLGHPRGQNVRHQYRLAMHPGRPNVSLDEMEKLGLDGSTLSDVKYAAIPNARGRRLST